LSQHLQLVAGKEPLEAGMLMLPGMVLSVVAGLGGGAARGAVLGQVGHGGRAAGGRGPLLRAASSPVRRSAQGVAANLLSIFSLVGFMFFLSQHLQLVAGKEPLEAGMLMLPGMVLSVVAGL
ncbi:hypothetical protein CTI14_51230, partial [Methylobacterium radiotolerans]